MRWVVLLIGSILVVAGLFMSDPSEEKIPLTLSVDDATRRDTQRGPVLGGLTPSGAYAWLGIPFADSPEGEFRWRAPRPVPRWTEARTATQFGPPCPQFASRLSASNAAPGTLIGEEDCLSLNVYAPGGTQSGSNLPVMVYLHGGGNTIGSAIPYDGSAFVQEQGVVMVTFNYRLGVLGTFSHAALRASANTPAEASGNFALLDMVAALAWVRDNVDAFGGDPSRVTLFGQSAGGRNIYSLLATPLAKGLFHGAIIQSGFPGTYPRLRAESPADDPQPGHPFSSHELLIDWLQGDTDANRAQATANLAALATESIPTFMRSLPLEALMRSLLVPGGMYSAPALVRDGFVLPEKPLPDLFASTDDWNRVPLLVGTNRDEMTLFMVLSERFTTKRWGLIPAPADSKQYTRLTAYHSDAWKAVGVDLPLARINGEDNEVPVFAYRFDWDDMHSNWLVNLPELLGATHALELDFLFGPLLSRIVPGVFHAKNYEGREALGRTMRDYWAGFAYSGKPGSGRSATAPAWPRWTPSSPWFMVLDESSDGGVRVETAHLTVDAVKQRLREETYLSERLRCAVYVDLYLANNGLPELFDAREYQKMGCAQFPAWSLAGQSR